MALLLGLWELFCEIPMFFVLFNTFTKLTKIKAIFRLVYAIFPQLMEAKVDNTDLNFCKNFVIGMKMWKVYAK